MEVDKSLKQWLDRQRNQYSRREQGKSTTLTDYRMEKLNSLGVVWRRHQTSWMEYYNQLKRFLDENGHINVPRSHHLYNWVHIQRKGYQGTSRTRLSDDRIEKLNELGFVWDYHEAVWNEHFQDLCRFHDYHGHCLVPHLYAANVTLARWVDQQRRQYKDLRDGKTSGLTPRRMKLLEDVGFVWNAHDVAWNDKFTELQEYMQTNGKAPQFSTKLGSWLKVQQRLYNRLLKGEKVSLTKERLTKLRSLGFCL